MTDRAPGRAPRGFQLPRTENHKIIRSSNDLPGTTNGRHQLKDNTIYEFAGFVTSPHGLELGNNTPLTGRFGSSDGFICTGGGPAIYGRGSGFFMSDMYAHAPGGTMFDLQADITTEMLVYDSAFSDAAGIANIADMGTIDGFRVPSFKGCNFENFDAGITFTGDSDKVFFSSCPFRGVEASNVVVLDFDANSNIGIVDITDCYVKGVQSDTEIINVDASSLPDTILQYRGTTHDSTVTRSNIINGGVSEDSKGVAVRDSFPLPNSKVTGDLSLNSPTTVTGSGAAPTQIAGSTTLNNSIRTLKAAEGVIQYNSKYQTLDKVFGNVSVTGINGEFAIWLAKNGSIIPRTKSLGFAANNSSAFGASISGTLDLQEGDTVSMYVENVGGSSDVTIEEYSLNV